MGHPPEITDSIGFVLIGLDEPYRIIVANNPVNCDDPFGLWSNNGIPNYGKAWTGVVIRGLVRIGQYRAWACTHNIDKRTLMVTTFLLACILIFVGLCFCDIAAGESEQIAVRSGTPRAWMLATTAILTERNSQRHDILGGCARTEERVAHWKRILSEWWDIHDREGLLKTLKWIEDGGQRSDFEKLGAFMSSLNNEQRLKVLARVSTNEQAKHQIDVIRKYYGKMGRKSLIGWDYVRYVSLCRWGYLVGFLSEDEAWARIMPAASILQRTFNSWKDMGENYLIGREFWSYELSQKDGKLYGDIYLRLLNDINSPWNRNQWNMNFH